MAVEVLLPLDEVAAAAAEVAEEVDAEVVEPHPRLRRSVTVAEEAVDGDLLTRTKLVAVIRLPIP